MKKLLPRVSFPVKYAIGLSLLMPVLWAFNAFSGMEDGWHDILCRSKGALLREGDPRIIIAAMDGDALQAWGLPPSRKMYVEALDAFKKLGVKVVAFDILFLESRPFDQELAAAQRRHGKVIQLFEVAAPEGSEEAHVTPPVKPLMDSAALLAQPSVSRLMDGDGHLRKVFGIDERVSNPKNGHKGALLLGLAGYAALIDKPEEEVIRAYADSKGNPKAMSLRFRQPKAWEHPSFKKGYYGDWTPYRYVPIDDVIKGRLDAETKKAFKGALVFVGSTATGYFDHYPNPFLSLTPGVETHAIAADNALHDDWLQRAGDDWTLVCMIAMIWLAVLLVKLPPMFGAVAAGATLFGWYVGTSAAFLNGKWFDFVAPAISLVLSFLGLTVHRVLTEGQEKKFIKDLFGQFVAPEVVDDLAKDPAKVKLGGEKKDLTMFFLDIAHFTDISEKMPPENLIVFLNKYLSELTRVVHDNKGVVDKYIGDCVMAFWNAPMPNPDHRKNACLAAIQCQQAMEELNAKLQPGEVPMIPAIRIGLNSGQATVGLTGSNKKLQYTVIGDEVNLASRLEGANKFFGSKIMASEATYSGAKDAVEARELGPVRVVGKQKPILVYELLAEKGKLSPQWRKALDHYNMGLALFKQQKYGEALLSFQEVVKIFPDDGPANLYLNTSKDYSVLPPDVHPVVFNLTAK